MKKIILFLILILAFTGINYISAKSNLAGRPTPGAVTAITVVIYTTTPTPTYDNWTIVPPSTPMTIGTITPTPTVTPITPEPTELNGPTPTP